MRDDIRLIRIDISRWDSPVARQFSIRSIPHLVLYNPEGEVIKQGTNSVGHILLPQLPDDSDGESQGGSLNSWVLTLLAIGGCAVALLIATKVFGPKKNSG